MNRLCFTLTLLVLTTYVSYAGIIQGNIKEQKGGFLPFATVYVKGTTIGTSANQTGFYQLHLSPGRYKLVCQYMGYQQTEFDFSIVGDETITHDFSLPEQTLQMKEFVVKASEDPAKYIMRQVIKRRLFHLNQIQAFQTDMYLKGTLRTRSAPEKIMGEKVEKSDMGLDSNGKGVLFLLEEEAAFFTQGKKSRTIIKSVRQSGSPNGLGFSRFPSVINFYNNNIDISEQLNPRGFISPVSENAFLYYSYKLEGDFKDGDHTIFKIKVSPRRAYEPLMSGTLFIVDDDWAIHSLNMIATKKSNMEFLDTLRIEQLYLPLGKDEWVIKQQVWHPIFKFFGFSFGGSFVTVYNNQKINQPIPDSVFKTKFESEYVQDANKKDSSYWKDRRPIPLEQDEARDYVVKDSIRLIDENPARRDSLRRIRNRPHVRDFITGGYSYEFPKNTGVLSTNTLLSGLVNYNSIEGWNVAPRISMWRLLDTGKLLTLKAAARYGFENTHGNGIARITYTLMDRHWRTRRHSFGLEGGKYVFQLNPFNPIDPLYNSVATLFYRKNYMKLYERWNATLFYNRNVGNGFRYSFSAGWQQRLPLENTTNFSYAKGDVGGFTSNYPDDLKHVLWEKHNAVILNASVSWTPGYTYTKYPDFIAPSSSDYPTFTASYQKGVPNVLDSKTDFDKWRVGVTDDISLKLLGSVSYNIAAGGFLNDKYASIPDLNHLYGNQLLLATPYVESFQLAPYYQFSNTKPLYGEAHVEWYLKGFLTNKIPLLRQLRWYLVTGTNTFYADKDFWHTEAYVGIDNLGYDKFRFLRLDFVWGRNSFNQESLSAFRLGISPSMMLGGGAAREKNEDW